MVENDHITTSLCATLEKWAADDLRSVNAQIEFLLKQATWKAGRIKSQTHQPQPPSEE
ncbi:MAG: hypothetical protein AAFV72_10120 [Cyanobacteria bacterium J06635_1]